MTDIVPLGVTVSIQIFVQGEGKQMANVCYFMSCSV